MTPVRACNFKMKQSCGLQNEQEGIVNNLYQAAVVSILAIGYSMLSKKILKMTLPSIQKFNVEDTGKLVTIVAASEMMQEYFFKQKILREHLNVQNGQYCDVDWRSFGQHKVYLSSKQLLLSRKLRVILFSSDFGFHFI